MCGKRYLPLNVIRGAVVICLYMLFAPEPLSLSVIYHLTQGMIIE